MNILGASLGELLRHGSQFGLGVQAAGRQNVMDQQAMDKERREELRQALIDQANIEQSQASAERDRSYAKSLTIPDPAKPLTQAQISGRLREWRSRNPTGNPNAAMAEIGGTPGFDPGLGWEAWADITKPTSTEKPTESAQAFYRRKQALAAAGMSGPEADAIASDETLFRSWYGDKTGTGGDETGQRQRVMAAGEAIQKIESQRGAYDTPEKVQMLNRLRDQVFKVYGIQDINELRSLMQQFGSAPSGGMEDPLGIR
jgi:hypothetical protein